MAQIDSPHLFVEVFPIRTAALPDLAAYQLDVGGNDGAMTGGKFVYRLRNTFSGHWVWSGQRIITDRPRFLSDIMEVVGALWQEHADLYGNLQDVTEDLAWSPTPAATADFVARGLAPDVDAAIRKLLATNTQNGGRVRVEVIYEIRGWVVEGEAAVSISLSSRLISQEDVKAYTMRIARPEDLIGILVADKISSFKGKVVEIVGTIADHRRRLLALATREDMRAIIERADGDEPVVRIQAGYSQGYDYVASALWIVVRTRDFHRFNINARQVQQMLRMEPSRRAGLLKPIANLLKDRGLIADAYNSRRTTNLFRNAVDVYYPPRLRFGGGQVRQYEEGTLLSMLRTCGLYKRSETCPSGRPLTIGLLTAISSPAVEPFLRKLQRELQDLQFTMRLSGTQRVRIPSRANLEAAIERLQRDNPDLVLGLFPDEADEDEEKWGVYDDFKAITIGRGLAGQVVYQATLGNSFASGNIVLGMLGKTGNIPFILADPLEYADLVVGIDIARRAKERLAGTINATAIARIYVATGEFLRYGIHDGPLEGETIPEHVLQSLFPLREFTGKRVVIHRDGYFRGQEKYALKQWAQRIGAEFYLVEVIKTGTPRLYAYQDGKIRQPPKAAAFILSQSEAFVVSSLPPFPSATPQPLRIRTDPPLTITHAIHSVLTLTVLHYGSLRPPRLPVTLHYSDRIASFALMGIKPPDLQGNIPFWL
jgi:Piwi domain